VCLGDKGVRHQQVHPAAVRELDSEHSGQEFVSGKTVFYGFIPGHESNHITHHAEGGAGLCHNSLLNIPAQGAEQRISPCMHIDIITAASLPPALLEIPGRRNPE
jgi:hypothetical protein